MNMKKISALFIAMALILSVFSFSVFAEETYVVEIGGTKYLTFDEIATKINTDGSDTTVKLLADIVPSGTVDFDYGEGDIIFTADSPVTVKQTALGTDWGFTKSVSNNIVIGENVTFEIYDNASGFYVYYGPSVKVNGKITGGQNWGCLYLFNGEHLVAETGEVSAGRIQLGCNDFTAKGKIDTNYLLVEGGNFVADGATVEA